MPERLLHITNGDSAASCIASTGIGGDILPWRDVLHEGPVPQGLSLDELSDVRSAFIADGGWGTFDEVRASFRERDRVLEGAAGYDEVTLWFEHDLYDQLQLIQLLDWFCAHRGDVARLSIICHEIYLGTIDAERARELFDARVPVSDGQMLLGRSAWAAFRSVNPMSVERLARGGTPELPYLADALVRHLEQFPSLRSGVSRSERQALEAIARGRATIGDAFVASSQEAEERIFLGDSVFFGYLESMSAGARPLIRCEDGEPIKCPNCRDDFRAFLARRLELTDDGRAVLDRTLDWCTVQPVDRWLGGVHLEGTTPAWRWDDAARALTRASL